MTNELVVDNFAGGGGASTGIEAALGRPVDIAINHDPEAIAMHRANHPETKHFCEDIWEVDPKVACGSRPVGLAWFSPDCKHFSRAKGTALRDQGIRGLAWMAIRWADLPSWQRPRIMICENVEEWLGWGPLDDEGQPIKARAGETFREWFSQLTTRGYSIEFRTLVAADYGTPTTRRRLYLVARLDGDGIRWPRETHGKGRSISWTPAADIIDWSLPCPSIFERTRPLAEATQKRIAEGIRRFVIEAAEPFIIPLRHGHYSTITGAGLREGCGAGTFRGQPLADPLATVCATNDKHLTAAFLTKFYGTAVGASLAAPLPTVTASDRGGGHLAEVRAFLLKYYGNGVGQNAQLPLHTITARDRFGLVMIHGEPYQIADIGMRMLAPHELFAAQGFPGGYVIAPEVKGKPLTKTAQIRCAGNSVCPPVAEAIVAANVKNLPIEVAA